MGSIRQRNGQLFFDFRFQGVRCREQTTLSDTQGNRKKLVPILERIEAAIKLGTFHFITQECSNSVARICRAEIGLFFVR